MGHKPSKGGGGYTGDDGSFNTGQDSGDPSADSPNIGVGAGGIGGSPNKKNGGAVDMDLDDVRLIETKFLLLVDANCGFDAAFGNIGGSTG